MNGAASHLINKGEEIIVMGFTLSEQPINPTNILLGEKNKFIKFLDEESYEKAI